MKPDSTKRLRAFLRLTTQRVVLPCLLLISVFRPTISSQATMLAEVQVKWRTPLDARTEAEFEEIFAQSQASPVTEGRLTRLLETALALLADCGYRYALLEPCNFRAANDSLSFDLVVTPGPVAVIASWELCGLTRTDPRWLADVLQLPVGVPATQRQIAHAIARIASVPNLSLESKPVTLPAGDSGIAIQLNLRESSPARFEGAIAAGAEDGRQRTLLGRVSLGLSGLFRRAHAVNLEYEHPQPNDRLMRLAYSEHSSLWSRLGIRLQFEDWRRHDHRQNISGEIDVSISRARAIFATLGARWQKLSPLESGAGPARLYEASGGLVWGRESQGTIGFTCAYSLHRRWGAATGTEESASRVRLESRGRGEVGLFGALQVSGSYAARWWADNSQLRAGDEWFLGGERLSGYQSRAIIAASGLWTRLELARRDRSGFGLATFGDLAFLTMFDHRSARPASVGLALLLDSPGRRGRLEVAWRDQASLRDGILRLSVVQGW